MVVEKGFKQTEVGVIPEDWEVKTIGSFTDLCAGGTPSTYVREYWNGDIRWMNSGELNYKRVFEVENRITELGLNNSATKLIPVNSILIGLAGQGKTRGTVAINKVELCTNQSIAAIFPCNEVDHDYLFFNLDSRYSELRGLSTGDGGRGGLNLTIIKNLFVPIPQTKIEQTAIANALSDMDALIAQTEKLIEKKKAIKQGVMQELLKPKEGWVTKKLGEVISGYQNGYGFSASGYSNKGTPIVTMAQIGLDGSFNLDETKVNRWRIEDFNTLKNYHLVNGDLIIAMTDVTPEKNLIGRMAIVNSSEVLLLNQRVGLLRLNTQLVNPYFLMLLSNMKDWRSYCMASASLGVQANIGTKDILNGEMTLPNIETQNEIAGIITELDIQIQLNNTKLQKLKHQKQGMMQALLTGKIRLI